MKYFVDSVLGDDLGSLELVAHTSSDRLDMLRLPAQAARVSHGREAEDFSDSRNDKLMEYLAEHDHMTPFEHQSATFLVTAPIFVAREWMRHRTQSYNEVSMRYTSDIVGALYSPEAWRVQSKINKQGSDGTLNEQDSEKAWHNLHEAYASALASYARLIELGVARELARLVIPVGHYTKFYATANMRNWAAFCRLRCAPTAQQEIRAYAHHIDTALMALWGPAWEPLRSWAKG